MFLTRYFQKSPSFFLTIGVLVVVSILIPPSCFGESSTSEVKYPDWQVSTGDLSGLTFTALGLNPEFPSLLFLGTSAGEIYRSADGGQTWLKTHEMEVPETFIRKVEERDFDYLSSISEIKSKDIEKLLELFRLERDRPLEVREISYSDISFEDVEINAVALSDIEFREDIDPDSVDLNEVDEDDIENIVIADESYLKNPDDVLRRLEQEYAVRREKQLSVSRRKQLEILSSYRDTYLSIHQILPVSAEADGLVMALSPIHFMISADGGRTWRTVLEVDLTENEFLISAVSPRNNPDTIIILSSAGLRQSLDRGQTWSLLPRPPGSSTARGLYLVEQNNEFILLSDNSLVAGRRSSAAAVIEGEFEALRPDVNTGLFSSMAVTGEQVLIGCDRGIVNCPNTFEDCSMLTGTGLPGKPVDQISLASMPNWLAILVDETPYFSLDAGASFQNLAHADVRLRFKSLTMTHRLGSGQILWGLTDNALLKLEIAKTGTILFKPRTEILESKQVAPPPPVPALYSGYAALLGKARYANLWDMDSFRKWKKLLNYAPFFPRLRVSFNFMDQDQDRITWSQNINNNYEPDYYIMGPWEYNSYTYLYEYYSVSFQFSWDLRRLIYSAERLMVSDRQARSYRRTKKQETAFRKLFHSRMLNRERLKKSDNLDLQTKLDLILQQAELEALLNCQIGSFKYSEKDLLNEINDKK